MKFIKRFVDSTRQFLVCFGTENGTGLNVNMCWSKTTRVYTNCTAQLDLPSISAATSFVAALGHFISCRHSEVSGVHQDSSRTLTGFNGGERREAIGKEEVPGKGPLSGGGGAHQERLFDRLPWQPYKSHRVGSLFCSFPLCPSSLNLQRPFPSNRATLPRSVSFSLPSLPLPHSINRWPCAPSDERQAALSWNSIYVALLLLLRLTTQCGGIRIVSDHRPAAGHTTNKQTKCLDRVYRIEPDEVINSCALRLLLLAKSLTCWL